THILQLYSHTPLDTLSLIHSFFFFFFSDPLTTLISTLSLHDALPIYGHALRFILSLERQAVRPDGRPARGRRHHDLDDRPAGQRSEEHTSELQSLAYLVCRLLLEKKKKYTNK